jgi:enterochelin esterase-like enzyme
MRGPTLLAALLAAIAAAAAAHARPARVEPPVVDTSFASHALKGRLAVAVYLPAGYGTDGRRYPVVYFPHGLPAAASAYRGASFVAEALRGRAILVAPQGARDGDSDPEYHDWGVGRDWETALSVELPAWVDAHFRTIPDRRARALVGLSAGGYGAFLIGLRHLDAFGAIESWSGYAFLPSIAAALRAHPAFIAFYVGVGDSRFADENRALDRELTGNRIPHLFRVYPGGRAQALWQAHAQEWLGLALRRLVRPRPA